MQDGRRVRIISQITTLTNGYTHPEISGLESGSTATLRSLPSGRQLRGTERNVLILCSKHLKTVSPYNLVKAARRYRSYGSATWVIKIKPGLCYNNRDEKDVRQKGNRTLNSKKGKLYVSSTRLTFMGARKGRVDGGLARGHGKQGI